MAFLGLAEVSLLDLGLRGRRRHAQNLVVSLAPRRRIGPEEAPAAASGQPDGRSRRTGREERCPAAQPMPRERAKCRGGAQGRSEVHMAAGSPKQLPHCFLAACFLALLSFGKYSFITFCQRDTPSDHSASYGQAAG